MSHAVTQAGSCASLLKILIQKMEENKSSFRDAVNAELLTGKTNAWYLFSTERQGLQVQ